MAGARSIKKILKVVFVTGATGFIGTRLVSELSKQRVTLRILSRKRHPVFDTVVCDLSHEKVPRHALESVNTVFHLAGHAHDLLDTDDKKNLYHAVNTESTTSIVELAANEGVERFVYISSVKAGGSAVTVQHLTEEDQAEPDGVYGKTKREAELKVLETGRRSGMHVAVVRPALVYGAGVKGNLRMMLKAVRSGWFPPIPETNNLRSMVHVDDLVNALLLVSGDQRANGEIFIATDGHDYSTRQIFDAMREALGKRVVLWSVPESLFSMAAWIGDKISGIVPFPFDSYRYQKLLGDECFSPEKLKSLGFKPIRTLYSTLPGMVETVEDKP